MANILRTGFISFAAGLLLASSAFVSAGAQDEGRQFSPKAGEAVNRALELANTGQPQSALSQLSQVLRSQDLNPYETSTIYQMVGQYSYELERHIEAQTAFEQALEAGGLLPAEAANLNAVIAQLMISNGLYREGAERLEAHLDAGGEATPQFIELLVNAWIQAEAYSRALPWAERWFESANPKTRAHFDLLNFLYNRLDMQGRQAELVKDMIARWPDDTNLMGVWASMLANGGREQEAFEVKKMMYLKGMLHTEAELLKVVQYYSFYDMPYQAATILEKEMDANRIARTPQNLTQLSTLFRQAREYKRALPSLEAAAVQSGEAATYAAWGEALYNEGECDASERAFLEAIDRGYDAGKSWMLIASCRYDSTISMERLNCGMSEVRMAEAPITRARVSAMEAFRQVPKPSSEHENARRWIQFIEAEKQAVQKRCDFGEQVRKERCFKAIQHAYDELVLSRTFTLDDPICESYIEEYDRLYRSEETQE